MPSYDGSSPPKLADSLRYYSAPGNFLADIPEMECMDEGIFNDRTRLLQPDEFRASFTSLNKKFSTFPEKFTKKNKAMDVLEVVVDSTADFVETSQYVDPLHWIDKMGIPGLRYTKIRFHTAVLYCVFQIIALLVQIQFLREIDTQANAHSLIMKHYCGAEHMYHGICLGPAWRIVYDQVIHIKNPDIGDSDTDVVINPDAIIGFETKSRVPTFLLGVEPVSPHSHVKYKVEVTHGTKDVNVLPREGLLSVLWKQQPRLNWEKISHGQQYGVFVEDKEFSRNEDSTRQWRATIHLLGSDDPSYFEAAASSVEKGATGLVSAAGVAPAVSTNIDKQDDAVSLHVFVVDSAIEHLSVFDRQHQKCSFAKSWESFVQKSVTRDHFDYFYYIVGFFVALQAIHLVLVIHRYLRHIDGSRLFGKVVLLKFAFQDFPQQILLAMYLYAWYASDGLECQMCLFDPEHCPINDGNTGTKEANSGLNYPNAGLITVPPSQTALWKLNPFAMMMGGGVSSMGPESISTTTGTTTIRTNLANINGLSNGGMSTKMPPATTIASLTPESLGGSASSMLHVWLVISILISALCNQLILDPSGNKTVLSIYDSLTVQEDELCFTGLARIVTYSLSILPLSTAFVFFSHSMLHVKHASILIYTFFMSTCLTGWITIFSVPSCLACDESCD